MSASFGGGVASSYGAGGGRMLPLPLVVDLVIFGFRWTKAKWDATATIAKETRSLKMKYRAELMPFAVLSLITEASTRSRRKK